ncbi:MAG: tRNA preQ1(34) S-adenosylmethionine ribosyltransferase-isomerase QueA [Filifactoraceae bacterium]
MNTKEFNYNLPEELIAQYPLEDRSSSRLMILDRDKGSIEHGCFKDIVDLLDENHLLIFNNTRVIPARIFGKKLETGATIELLLLKRLDLKTWEVMARPAKRLKLDTEIEFSKDLSCKVVKVLEDGLRQVEFKYEGVFEEILEELGTMPLPPYIKEKLEDKERYQTVYSKELGSAAAPTAGLHFTNEILEKLKSKGVQQEFVTLHVGLGTFLPVKVEDVTAHVMHSEYYEISEDTAERINQALDMGKKVVCVGTTSVRTIESAAEDGKIKKLKGSTKIFIYPGYNFKIVDSLITNFHLPESTLIMLVSAIYNKDKVLKAYEEAVKERYRFFSFGDAMFIK